MTPDLRPEDIRSKNATACKIAVAFCRKSEEAKWKDGWIWGFSNFWRADEVGSKIKQEKGSASCRRARVRCRAVPAPFLGKLRTNLPLTNTFSANSVVGQKKRSGVMLGVTESDFLRAARGFIGVRLWIVTNIGKTSTPKMF